MNAKIGFGVLPMRRSPSLLQFAVLLTLWIVFPVAGSRQVMAQSQAAISSAKSPQGPGDVKGNGDHADEPEEIVDERPEPGDVYIDGRKILSVYQPIGSFTAKDRAEKITERILAIAQEGVDPSSVALKPQTMWTEISAGGKLLMAVSDEDARSAGKPRATLAG